MDFTDADVLIKVDKNCQQISPKYLPSAELPRESGCNSGTAHNGMEQYVFLLIVSPTESLFGQKRLQLKILEKNCEYLDPQ